MAGPDDQQTTEEHKLQPEFDAANASDVPLEKPAPTPEDDAPATTSQQFGQSAQNVKPKPKPGDEDFFILAEQAGSQRNKDGVDILTGPGQISLMDSLNIFFQLIGFLLQGKTDDFIIMMNTYSHPDTRVDISQRAPGERMHRNLVSTAENAKELYDNGLRGSEILEELISSNAFLRESGIDSLLKLIVSVESSGGDANIIYNYKGGPGLQPGDVTAGGLTVPDITTMTVNEVLEWQRQYLEEQYTIGGIERGTGSSAAGAFQFVSKTLKEMRDNGYIDGDRIFDLEAQTELAIKRMISNRDLSKLFKENISESEIRNIAVKFQSEWEGLQQHVIGKVYPGQNAVDLITATLKEFRADTLENLGADAIPTNGRNLDIQQP